MTSTLTYRFTVTGRGDFPHDMLRYDRCWPAFEVDTPKMDRPVRYSSEDWREPRSVRMEGLRPPTVGRWESFGWKVEVS